MELKKQAKNFVCKKKEVQKKKAPMGISLFLWENRIEGGRGLYFIKIIVCLETIKEKRIQRKK